MMYYVLLYVYYEYIDEAYMFYNHLSVNGRHGRYDIQIQTSAKPTKWLTKVMEVHIEGCL